MEYPKAEPEKWIGTLVSDLEGAEGLVRGLKEGEAGFAVVDLLGPDDERLRCCDLLIVSQARWQAQRERLQAAPNPALIVLCPANDLGVIDPTGASPAGACPAGACGAVAFLPYPVPGAILALHVGALLERRAMEADLRYRLKEREDVLMSISEVFFSVDHEFRYTFFNEKAEKVGGKLARDIIGHNMWEVFPLLKNTKFERQMRQVAKERQILVEEYLGPITGGWFEMRIYPSAGGISALFVDITARKKAEEELKRAKEQLTEANSNLERAVQERTAELHSANEQLEELLYSIAHDLRSPLRSMQGFAQAFVEDFSAALDDRAREYAKRMTSAAVFMDRMLGDLIELSRVSKTELQLEEIDVAAAWRSAMAQHEERIARTGAEIRIAADLGRARANLTLVVQILANLLGNALKFTRPGVRPEIRIWTEEVEGGLLGIYVEDQGIGIDDRFREKIFRIFERLNGSDYEGTGIGLAVARKAAERMKGQLDFTSRPGVGTTFCLKVPGKKGGGDAVSTNDPDRGG